MFKSDSKIYLVHATPVAIEPVTSAFRRLWPQAQTRNLLDDGLTGDLKTAGVTTEQMGPRMASLVAYTRSHGAEAVLFTCSAFSVAIDEAKRQHPIPILKPNEAMFDEAIAHCRAQGGPRKIGLLTTFAPAGVSMADELKAAIAQSALPLHIETANADGAMEILSSGDAARHDQLIVQAAQAMPECDLYLLGQFSMARAQALVAQRLQKPVLTSPSSAVTALQRAFPAAA